MKVPRVDGPCHFPSETRGEGMNELLPLEAPVKAARTAVPHGETLDDAVREHILEVLRETNADVMPKRPSFPARLVEPSAGSSTGRLGCRFHRCGIA